MVVCEGEGAGLSAGCGEVLEEVEALLGGWFRLGAADEAGGCGKPGPEGGGEPAGRAVGSGVDIVETQRWTERSNGLEAGVGFALIA